MAKKDTATKATKEAKKPKETKAPASVEAKAEHPEEARKAKAHKAPKSHGDESTKDRHCKIASCKRTYRAKGYCTVHYKKWRHGEYGLSRYKTCVDKSCRKPMAVNRHGLCEDHFQKYYIQAVEAPPTVEKAPEKEEQKAAG